MMKRHLTALLTAAVLLTQTLPVRAEETPFTPGKDNWHVANSPLILGNYYRLTERDTEIMQSKLTRTEQYLFRKNLQAQWQGCCYGLAVTTVLAWQGVLDYRRYDPEAEDAYHVRLTEPLISMIDYYQQMQVTDAVHREMRWAAYYETSDQQLQKLTETAKDGTPALLCYYGHFHNRKDVYGHAVVAFGYETGAYAWDGRDYDARVLIYDYNPGTFEDTTCLYIDTTDNTWCIPAYQLTEKNAGISYVSADPAYLNNCGIADGERYTSERPPIACLGAMTVEGGYACTKAAFDGTVWQELAEDPQAKIFQYVFGDALQCADLDIYLPDTESGYRYHVDKEQAVDVSIAYEDLLLAAEGTAQDIWFSPEGTVLLSAGQASPYRLEIVSNESRYAGVLYDLVVSGGGADVQLSLAEDGYLLQGKALWDVTITGSGENTEDVLCIATDAERVLIRETAEQKLAASIDLDGDGVFESALSPSCTLGDLNGDGEANASDAAQILIAAARLGAGEESGLTPAQEQAADVDGNGEINAADAALILMYAAKIGAGVY